MLRRSISRTADRGTKPSTQRHAKGSTNTLRSCLILTPLLALLCLWLYATFYILSTADANSSISLRGVKNRTKHANGLIDVIRHRRKIDGPQVGEEQKDRSKQTRKESTIISRNAKVAITSSARGNLGPPSVLNQNPPGKDWLKDRWQAASDMGGTAIPGSHWVVLDFSAISNGSGAAVYVTKVVLDWETAYAKDYRIETRMDAPTGEKDDNWCILYDGSLDSDEGSSKQYPHRQVEEYGQSPGVKQKLPLHIIHTIFWEEDVLQVDDKPKCRTMRNLRIFIRKPARGWGVSLWQVDVYGFESLD